MRHGRRELLGRCTTQVLCAPLKHPMKRALIILLEDEKLFAAGSQWRSPRGRIVLEQTFYALYDRYLIKVYVESKSRGRHTAVLTDVGHYAASDIRREMIDHELQKEEHPSKKISEEAARFIQQVVS